ncbi:MAG TPA: RluA family pseudouridine synthase [Gemmatimonadota bacterium]|nr:RluA family pseudouridine synthase [Gemmatimonadota bacterium]
MTGAKEGRGTGERSAAGDPSPVPDEERLERLTVDAATDERLDRWLADRLELSRSRVAGLIESGRVLVDGKPASKSDRPPGGGEIEVRIPAPAPIEPEPEDLPLEIVYEDAALAVVEKPAGMVVHPAPGHRSGTMVNALLARLDAISHVGAPLRPGIVHRLDRDTSGLLVVAKTDEAHRALSRDLARRRVRRGYLAAAWGHLDVDEDTIDRPLGRDPRDRKRRAVVEGGRRAVTHVKRLERWVSADLVALRLETGRTHQIRVHLKALGHPVVGDPLYAPGWERGFVGAGGRWAEDLARHVGRMFLHAARLSFWHPVTGRKMTFTSELPGPLREAVTWARETIAPGP